MVRQQWRRLALVSWLGVGLALRSEPVRAQPPSASEAQADANLADAKALFRQGVALLEAGDVERALELFLRSRALVPSGRNTTNAAICLQRLGRDDEALEMFQETFTSHLADLSEADRRTLEPAIRQLLKRVGSLSVTSNVEAATVYVDGRARGRLPEASPIRVTAGLRRVRVLRDGYEPYDVTVEVAAGGKSAIDARLTVLARRGQLRVEDAANPGSDVLVDGVVVGTSPWEGTLGPGRYVVSTEHGDSGGPPVSVVVLDGQVALVRVRSAHLGPVTKLEAEPSTSEIAVDDVLLGRGAWQGRLAEGRHVARMSEAGYVTWSDTISVGGAGSRAVTRRVRLVVDPTHPRWPRQPVGRFWVSAFGGAALGARLDATSETRAGDHGVVGGVTGLRAGFRFALGVSLELAGGYAAFATSFARTESRHFETLLDGSNPARYVTHPLAYHLDDQVRLGAPFVGAGAGVRSRLGRLELVARTTVGEMFASTTDAMNGTASGGASTVRIAVVGPTSAPAAAPFFVWPELGVGLAMRSLHVGGAIGAMFFPLDGPSYPGRQLWVVNTAPDGAHPGSARNAPQVALSPGRAYGPFAVFTPLASAEYDF